MPIFYLDEETLQESVSGDVSNVESFLGTAYGHLLKWKHQSKLQTKSWITSILLSSYQANEKIQKSSAKNHLNQINLNNIYKKGIKIYKHDTKTNNNPPDNRVKEDFDTLDKFLDLWTIIQWLEKYSVYPGMVYQTIVELSNVPQELIDQYKDEYDDWD